MAQLVRKREGRVFLGVCAGLADWWQVDRTVLRVLYVLVSVCSAAFPGILCYLVLGILMPPEEDSAPPAGTPPADPPPADPPSAGPPPPPDPSA